MSNLVAVCAENEIQSSLDVDVRRNPLVASRAERPKGERARELLRTRGVEVTPETFGTTPTNKLSLLRGITDSFFPTKLEESLYGDFHDAIQTSWRYADPLGTAAAARYNAFAEAIRTASPVSMPMAKHRGEGFLLCCSSGSAGLRFVERAADELGRSISFAKNPNGEDIPYWPAMVVQWPSCGTEQKFYANFLSTFDGTLGRGSYFKSLFRPTAKKETRPIYVMGLASIVNVGILFVTGATSRNFHFDNSERILAFLEEFMGRTGIPVVFTCTAPVYEQIVLMGSIFGSLSSGGTEEILWLDASSAFHADANLHLLNQSLMWEQTTHVPSAVLDCASACAHGSREALNVFYRLLHIAAVRKDKNDPEVLLPGVASTMKTQSDQLQRVASYLTSFFSTRAAEGGPRKPDGSAWSDFLSLNVYRAMGV